MDSVIIISNSAFAFNNLNLLPPMDSLISIGDYTYKSNKLTSLPQMNSLKKYRQSSFFE